MSSKRSFLRDAAPFLIIIAIFIGLVSAATIGPTGLSGFTWLNSTNINVDNIYRGSTNYTATIEALIAAGGNNSAASRNSGATVGPRSVLNFIEGANISLSVVDDPGGDEIDITITSTGGAGAGNTLPPYDAIIIQNATDGVEAYDSDGIIITSHATLIEPVYNALVGSYQTIYIKGYGQASPYTFNYPLWANTDNGGDGIHVYGDGMNVTWIKAINGGESNCFVFGDSNASVPRITGAVIEGIGVDMNNRTNWDDSPVPWQDLSGVNGILFMRSEDCTVRKCWVNDSAQYGIHFQNPATSYRGIATENRVGFCSFDGIQFSVQNGVCSNNIVTDCSDNGIANLGADSIIEGNVVLRTGYTGGYAGSGVGSGISFQTLSVGVESRASGNIVRDVKNGMGIEIIHSTQPERYLVIEDNTISGVTGGGSCIKIGNNPGTGYFKITGNMLIGDGVTTDGITIYQSGTTGRGNGTITDNSIYGFTGAGIHINAGEGIYVANNYIRDCAVGLDCSDADVTTLWVFGNDFFQNDDAVSDAVTGSVTYTMNRAINGTVILFHSPG